MPESDLNAERPRTLVDEAVEAIIARATNGVILPGDRIIETEIAQSLGMSRVPVREALRMLESQGLVVSEPYKGIRLRPITRERLAQILEVRTALEVMAAQRALTMGRNLGSSLDRLVRRFRTLESVAEHGDSYVFASADTAFHRELCRLSGNEVLCACWESLARQLTVLLGLYTLDRTMQSIVQEHDVLLDAFRSGDQHVMATALTEHFDINTYNIDIGHLLARRRSDAEARAS